MTQKVYLAGGIRSNWQEKVTSKVDATFYNPREKEIDRVATFYNPREKEIDRVLTLQEFGTWDLHFIKKCDIVFAYMERTNPSGIGMSVEMGYAKALGKTVILCLEPNNEHVKDGYLSFMKKVSDIVYEDIDEAIKHLSLYK